MSKKKSRQSNVSHSQKQTGVRVPTEAFTSDFSNRTEGRQNNGMMEEKKVLIQRVVWTKTSFDRIRESGQTVVSRTSFRTIAPTENILYQRSKRECVRVSQSRSKETKVEELSPAQKVPCDLELRRRGTTRK